MQSTYYEYYITNNLFTVMTCPMPPPVQYGSIQTLTSPVHYGSYANVSCEEGYVAMRTELECTSNGTWTYEAECIGRTFNLLTF